MMVGQLTKNERHIALIILVALAICGLAMAVAGRDDPLGAHGALVILAALAGIFFVIAGYYLPEPAEERHHHYYDDPTKAGIILAMGWAVFGLFVGDWVAWLFVYPEFNFDAGWSSFGRIRPVHTTAVIFGFGGNGLIATSLYVLQRTSRARLPDQLSPWFVLLGYNLFCVIAVTGYMMGITQSKEYAEPEWYTDIWLVIVWVTYFIIYLRTLARRKEPHIYVANWYYMAFILVVAVLHIVNNLAIPVSLGHAKSYSSFSGVQDAMTQWWYGHNAVAFFLTAGFLGMMYYYLPKRADRPIFSYRMSIISFWGITFLYMWAGSHHLHYTALPQWVQTLGMTFSVMLLVPSWASAANALLTLNGAWDKVRDDATLRFMMVAAVFYGLSTFEGSFLAVRPVNSLFPLHGLDGRPCPCRRAGLGRDDHFRGDLCVGALALERGGHVFGKARRGPFLVRRCRDHHLCLRDVELRHHPRSDVADLQRKRDARLLICRLACRDAPLLHRACDRRALLPDWGSRRLLQHLDDDPDGAA
jgi:cytochrome c oxidase cbb3-type subunit I